MAPVPVEIKLTDERKLIIEQKSSCYFCSLYQFSAEKDAYLQITGADNCLTLKIEGAIDVSSNFLLVLQWIGEKNAVTLFNSMHRFGDSHKE